VTKLAHTVAMLGAIAAAAGCGIDKPLLPDGRAGLVIMVADTSGIIPQSVPGEPFFLDSTEVRLQARNQELNLTETTDADGAATFDRLDTGTYSVFARREILIDNNKKLFTGSFDVTVQGDETRADTVLVKLIAASQLMINEVYYAGACAASFYFYDQYVELYNASPDTMYLDGIILTRQQQTKDPDMELKDYVTAIYAYQFPGTPVTGREHPIYPKQFVLIAADAIDHSQYCPNAADLSHADWETFNPLGNDYDVPGVPNILSIMPSVSVDYLINLSHNAVVIATGEEYTIDAENHMRIPIKDVIDGVEYNGNPAYSKEMTVRVDAGFAGIGITRYTGQSTERRELGLDTNDSTFDFMNLLHPTPGYYHAP
jgi:hypothetical protein